jgi:hypothetical protein
MNKPINETQNTIVITINCIELDFNFFFTSKQISSSYYAYLPTTVHNTKQIYHRLNSLCSSKQCSISLLEIQDPSWNCMQSMANLPTVGKHCHSWYISLYQARNKPEDTEQSYFGEFFS